MRSFRHRRFKVLRILGEGGMGRVWLAEDLLLKQSRLALKVYPPGTSADLLRREFLALRELRHPGIARAFHFGTSESDGAPFFTMEYISGDPLDRHLRARIGCSPGAGPGAAGPERAAFLLRGLDLFIQAASAAGHLHRRGLLHLDLKPANILVQDAGAGAPGGRPAGEDAVAPPAGDRPFLVLIDFGLIRAIGAGDGGPRRGTVPFMAPEIFDGGEIDARADIYALGVTFYLALTGRYPFEARDPDGWARAHRSVPPAPAPELPHSLERILLCALAKSPAKRFSDALVLERALLSARSELRPRGAPWRPPPVEPELAGRERELVRFDVWKDRERPSRPLLLVAGADGIGKSRLLSAMETRLEMSGASTVWARTGAEDEAPLLAEAVRRAALLYPGRMPSRRESAGERLLDHRAGLSPPDAATRRLLETIPPEEVRRIARRLAVRRLSALLRTEPVYLLVDDLEGADPEGREFLVELAAAITPAPGVPASAGGPPRGGIIAALRSSPEVTTPLRAHLQSLRAGAAWLPVGPLSLRATRRILEASGVGSAGRAVSWTEVHRRSGGNPLYLLEELRALKDGERSRPGDRDLKDRAIRRLSELDEFRRRLVILLALSGRPLTVEVLARAAGAGEDEVARASRDLAMAGIFAGGLGRPLRFAHRSIADIAAGLAPPSERALLHRTIATAFSDSGAPRADVAHHLFEAGDPDRAIAILDELARDPGSPELETPRALPALERASRALGCGTESGRRMMEVLGDRLDQAGQFEAARRARAELAAASGIEGFERARHLRKLAALCHRMGDPSGAERSLAEALRIFGMTPPERPSASPGEAGLAGPAKERALPSRDPSGERLAALAELALLHHFKDDGRAEECARVGLRLFSSLRIEGRGARSTLLLQRAIDLHGVAGQIAIRKLALGDAISLLSAGLRLARTAGEPVNAAFLLNNLGLALHLESRFREALDAFRRAQRIADDLGDSAALFAIRCNVAQIEAKLGRFTRALEDLDRLGAEPGAAQSERLRLNLLYTRALVLSLLGDPSADWEEVARLSARLGDRFLSGFAAVYRAEALIARGGFSAARTLLEDAGGPATGRILAARAARIEAALGFHDRAAERIARYRGARESLPELVDAWNRLHLGGALLDLGEIEAARTELSAAEKFFRERKVAPGEIEAALLLADLELRRAGGAGDETGAALAAARSAIDRARSVEVEAPPGASPRLRSPRIDLLLVRAELRRLLSMAGEGGGASAARLGDLLASAGGSAHLRGARELLVQFEALSAAAARIGGHPSAERAAVARLVLARSRIARGLTPADRRAHRRVGLLERLGLAELEAGRRRAGWPPWAAEALAGALRAIAGSVGSPPGGRREALKAALACLTRPLGAPAAGLVSLGTDRARLTAGVGTLRLAAGWRPPAVPASRPIPGGTILTAPLPASGKTAGALVVRLAGLPGDRSAPALKVMAAFADLFSSAGALAGGPAVAGAREEEASRRRGDRREIGAAAERTRTIELADRPSCVGLFGKSPAVRKLARLIEAAASADISVLITGESGTGKEVVARAIHRTGRRAHGPFISQNCSAIPGGLLEADLFGYERGAFTGAEKTKSGYILKAQGGTFLLDEIGDADLSTQAKVLRVLEEKSMRPVGGRREVPVDVRFLAVTQRDIDALVAQGSFRKDLYYRLAGLRIHVPPLRERVEDIGVLLVRFLSEILDRAVRLSPRALSRLEAHSWPGNVRELTTVAQRLALGMAGGARVVPLSLVEEALDADRSPPAPGLLTPGALLDRPYPEARRAFERESLRSLWSRHRGSLAMMARELGTTVRSIYRRFEKLGLRPKDFRQKSCGKNGPC